MANEGHKALKLSGWVPLRPADEIVADLEKLRALLVKWQRVQNLVSRETLDQYWVRHVADSLQLLNFVSETDTCIVDLGSGGGFPALPMAIGLKGSSTRFVLVEANARKVAFLRAVVRELGLNAEIIDERIEKIVSRETKPASIVTARALAPLSDLCAYVQPFWGVNTRALFLKGREHVEELIESGAAWHYDVVTTTSVTDRSGVVLELTNLRPRVG